MATAGDGRSPYGSGGAGGKFRKRPFRRTAQATPYDRPPTALRNNNPSLLTKLVDPASKLIYAGAHRLFGVFRKRLPSISLQGTREVNEEPQAVPQEAGKNTCAEAYDHSTHEGGNSAGISAATGMSELEQMLKQKTFTRSEIQHLTALLHSRTIESTSDDVAERNGVKSSSSPSPLLMLETSTGSLRKDGNERDSFHASITTPVVSSKVREKEIASPADLAKAYMGSRPMKVAPSGLASSSQAPGQGSKLLNDASGIPTTPFTSVIPKTANSYRGLENGFLTPRSRGRSAMYSMARTPYSRGPSAFSPKGIKSDYGNDAALTTYQSSSGHVGNMALKRRSCVLEDDIGSGGPLRRTRQKANLLSQSSLSRDKRELGYTASQNLLLSNGPDSKVTKGVEENAAGFASVPTKSTQMATKILEQLERLSPKEKSSRSTSVGIRDNSPSKLTLSMLHGQALRSLEKVDSPKYLPSPVEIQKSEIQHHVRFPDSHEPNSQSKEVEENVSRKLPINRNMLPSVNGDVMVPSKDNASIVTMTDPTPKLPIAEPSQKKHAFQMSAPEDFLEVDDDINANGHVSFPLVETNKPEASLVIDKPVSAEVVQTPPLPEVSKTPLLVDETPALPEATKIPEQAKLKEVDNATSSSNDNVGLFGGSVREQGIGLTFPSSPPSTTTTQTGIPSQSTLQMDKVSSEKELPVKESPNALPTFGIAEKVSPLKFSSNGSSEIKPDASSDQKALNSTSVLSSFTKNDQVKFSIFNNESGNDQKSANIFGKSESLASTVPAATSTSGIFSFGSSTTTTPNNTAASSPPILSSVASFPASGANMNSLFNNSSSNVTSASTTTAISTTTTTTASSSIFSTSVPAPLFSFGSASSNSASTLAPTSMIETAKTNVTDEKEPKSNMAGSPFGSTSFATTTTGSSLFGFSSPAVATTTTNNQSQGSFFNVSSEPQANTQAVPFQFGSSSSSLASGSTSGSSGSSLFGSSAPAFSSSPGFGLSSMAASSETKTGNSTSGPATSIFGSAASSWPSPQTSGFGSTFSSPSPVFSFGASASMPSTNSSPITFGSSNTGATMGSSLFSFSTSGATNSSFGTPSVGQSVFGNPTPVFGAATASTNNNDHMSMEDSMAEDSMQTPSPVSPFGQAPAPTPTPNFMFGSATPNPTQPAVPFQFGGQPNQTPTQNPFQSSSVEFNAGGGSFSLGSGGDKSGRRIVRVKNKNRRK